MSTPVSNPVLGTASESAMALNDKVNELKTLCEGFKGKEGSDEKVSLLCAPFHLPFPNYFLSLLWHTILHSETKLSTLGRVDTY